MPAKPQVAIPGKTAEELITEFLSLKDWMAAEAKRFNEHMSPYKARSEAIENELLAMLNALGGDGKAMLSSDAGTAYKSTIMDVSISPEGIGYCPRDSNEQKTGREALLDFALDNWDEIGNELLLFKAQKDAVKKYMEEHDGLPPPGLVINYFTRCNIRRS